MITQQLAAGECLDEWDVLQCLGPPETDAQLRLDAGDRLIPTYDTVYVQEIGIVGSRVPMVVDRPAAGAPYVYLTFEGLRESRTIGDKPTRICLALPVADLARLRELLV
jgi:hypothetical protein